MKTQLIAAAVAVAFATPALADFYIVQDSSTKRCQIVEQKPTSSTTVVIGDGKVYTSRDEAESAMKTVEVFNSTTGSGNSTTTTTTVR